MNATALLVSRSIMLYGLAEQAQGAVNRQGQLQ